MTATVARTHSFCSAPGCGAIHPAPLPSCPRPAHRLPAPLEEVEEAAPVVHIVDPDHGSRNALCDMLRVAGLEARIPEDFGEFLRSFPQDCGGCLLLDPSALSGELTIDIAARSIPIIMLAANIDGALAVRAIKAGVIDFLKKPASDQDVLEAVTTALAADRERRRWEARHASLRQRYRTLTCRERQVMALVTMGRMNKQVAFDLGLSEVTVKVHRGSVMRKMGSRTLADLVRMADALLATGDIEQSGADPRLRSRH